MTVDDVKARLSQLGYSATVDDEATISYEISKVENYIKAFCNISELPLELHEIAVDRVCGEFLNIKKYSGAVSLGLSSSGTIMSIHEGDTTITYGDKTTAEGRLDSLIGEWLDDGLLVRFRCVKW